MGTGQAATRGSAIGAGVAWTARWSLRVLLVAAGFWLVGYLVAQLWSIVLPVVLAIVLATILWPPAAWLRRHRFPPALASAVVLLAGIVVLAALVAVVVTSVSGSLGQITRGVTDGIQAIRNWLSGPPLNLADSQLNTYVQQVTTSLQQSVSTIASSVLAGIGSIASGVVTVVLTLLLGFLFVKDGPRFLPWLGRIAGDGVGGHLSEVAMRV